jgi:O-antigen/teichoic acid export membrane protein
VYNAGHAIVGGYVGMVFSAMSIDYFPRLAGVIDDELKWKKLVNEQAELVLIILGVVLVLLLTATPLLIRILLSEEFMASQNFIQFAVLAIPLKGLVWAMGYVILAKGNNKLFLTVEIIASLITLSFNLLFYHLYGLTGLGISMSLNYLISSLILISVLKKRYGFQFTFGVYKLLAISILSLVSCLLSLYFLEYPYAYFAEFIIVLATTWFFIYEFNQRISIKSLLVNFKNRLKK